MIDQKIPKAAEEFDKLAKGYDDHFLRDIDIKENEVTFSIIKNNLKPGNVLDLGSGSGLFLQYIQLPVNQYVGIDFSQGMIDEAKCKFPKYNFVNADMRDLSCFEDNTFDNIVTTFASMNYVPEINDIVENIYKKLKVGGRIIIQSTAPKYVTREHHIANSNIYPYTTEQLKHFFKIFKIIDLFGMNYNDNVENFEKEIKTLGKTNPNEGYWVVMIAEKHNG